MRALRTKVNVNPPDGDFQFGRVRNDPGDGSGTPVDEALVGDLMQFFEKLMLDAGISANNLPEQGYSGYQLNQALAALIAAAVAPINALNPSGVATKVIAIGDWNMNSTGLVNINHGLTLAKIVSVSATIIIDGGGSTTPLISGDPGGTGTIGGGIQTNSAQVSLIRTTGGFFNNTNYDATSFNRGYIVITYLP